MMEQIECRLIYI